MESDHSQPPVTSDPFQALPPVAPPSGRFILQLFLVPGLIVACAVLLWLLFFGYLGVGGTPTPAYFLQQLDSDNADIRWRGASDLAQVLKRPESLQLRANPTFALDLVARLRRAVDDLWALEKRTQDKIDQHKLGEVEQKKEWKKLAPQRDHVRFLAAALGDFALPVGVGLLSELALKDDSPDLQGNTLRRRQAVWALGNLGENIKEFAKLPAERQAEVLEVLQKESAADTPRGAWAGNALHYLGRRQPASAALVLVDHTLARCARADDRYLRAQVALALNFWAGDAVEETLLLLSRDDGHGTLLRITELD